MVNLIKFQIGFIKLLDGSEGKVCLLSLSVDALAPKHLKHEICCTHSNMVNGINKDA